MNEELTAFIIKELSKHHNRNEIIRTLCEERGLSWKQSEQMLTLVESKHKRAIATRQTPLLLFLSIGTLLLGIGLVVYNTQIILAIFQKDLLGQILAVRGGYYRLLELLTGVGMTTGGAIGLWKALGSIFPS